MEYAEKAIKALLIHHKIDFPYVYLAELLTLLQQAGAETPEPVKKAARLTRFALASCHPGITEPVTRQEHNEAASLAETVVQCQWVESRNQNPGRFLAQHHRVREEGFSWINQLSHPPNRP